METKGLIERFADPGDGRVRMFKITELGKEKLEADKRLRLERYNEWDVLNAFDAYVEEDYKGYFSSFREGYDRITSSVSAPNVDSLQPKKEILKAKNNRNQNSLILPTLARTQKKSSSKGRGIS